MCLGKQEASCRGLRIGREHWELFGAVRRNMTLRCHHLKVVCQYYDGFWRVQNGVRKEIIKALCIYQPPVMSQSAAKIIQGLSFCQRHVGTFFWQSHWRRFVPVDISKLLVTVNTNVWEDIDGCTQCTGGCMDLRYRHGASFPPSNFDSFFSNSDKLSWILQVEKLKLKNQTAKKTPYISCLLQKGHAFQRSCVLFFRPLIRRNWWNVYPSFTSSHFRSSPTLFKCGQKSLSTQKDIKVLQERHWTMSASTLTLLPVEEGPLIIGVRGNISAVVLRTRQFWDNPFYNFIMT